MLIVGRGVIGQGKGSWSAHPSMVPTMSSVEAALSKSASGSPFSEITWKFYIFYIVIYKKSEFFPALKDMLLAITVSEAQGTKTAPKLKMKAKIRLKKKKKPPPTAPR